MPKPEQRIRVNHYIRTPRVKVIASDGNFIGEMATYEALKLAQNEGLDLIEINGKSFPPTVKIANLGKMKYEQKKKDAEMKKHQKVVQLKELAFHCTTEEHDLQRQVNQAKNFLSEGHKVRFVCKFRGRELAHIEVGQNKLEWIIGELSKIAISTPISMEGKNMSSVLSPAK